MPHQLTVRPRNSDRVVLSLGDNFYMVTEIHELSKRSKISHVETATLDMESSRAIPAMPVIDDLKEVVYTKHEGRMVVLMGKEIIRAAQDKGVPKVPGRFVAPYVLKQAKR